LPFWRATDTGIVLLVRLTPKGGRDAVDGVRTGADGREALAVRVRAAPEKGEANAALIVLLAGVFHRPKAAVRIVQGTSGRMKQVAISGDKNALGVIAGRHQPVRID
jgi:uncharacterized protein (TIGR00251 family)